MQDDNIQIRSVYAQVTERRREWKGAGFCFHGTVTTPPNVAKLQVFDTFTLQFCDELGLMRVLNIPRGDFYDPCNLHLVVNGDYRIFPVLSRVK